jgi:RNA recognition motif-containing protein
LNIHVGNLAWSVATHELRSMIEKFAEVVLAEVIVNRHSGRSRGYGFVQMAARVLPRRRCRH